MHVTCWTVHVDTICTHVNSKKHVSAPFACVCHGWVPSDALLHRTAQQGAARMHAFLMQPGALKQETTAY